MRRLAIDQDQVIADLLGEWVKRYNYDFDDNLKVSDVVEWNWCHLVKPECGKKIYSYLDDPELFESLPVIKDSQEIVEKISRRFEVFIVTAPWNAANVIPKSNWLQKHFSFISEKNYVFARNKSIIQADWLIDDKPENLINFSGTALLFDAPHNRVEQRFYRVNDWLDVGKYFEVI